MNYSSIQFPIMTKFSIVQNLYDVWLQWVRIVGILKCEMNHFELESVYTTQNKGVRDNKYCLKYVWERDAEFFMSVLLSESEWTWCTLMMHECYALLCNKGVVSVLGGSTVFLHIGQTGVSTNQSPIHLVRLTTHEGTQLTRSNFITEHFYTLACHKHSWQTVLICYSHTHLRRRPSDFRA